jgi:hypothetical protein
MVESYHGTLMGGLQNEEVLQYLAFKFMFNFKDVS